METSHLSRDVRFSLISNLFQTPFVFGASSIYVWELKKNIAVVLKTPWSAKFRGNTQQTNPWDYAPNVKTHGNIKDFSRSIVHCSPSMYQWICCLCQYLPLKSPQIPPATFRKDRSVVEDLSSVSFFGRKCQGVSAAFGPCRFTTLEGLWLYPQNTRNPYMQIMPKEVHNLNEFRFKDSRPFWKDSSKLNHFTTYSHFNGFWFPFSTQKSRRSVSKRRSFVVDAHESRPKPLTSALIGESLSPQNRHRIHRTIVYLPTWMVDFLW